mgnify:CR=1 FL=1
MSYLRFAIGIFFILTASRLIPHPPNFTSLIALSFYVPIFYGLRFIPAIIGSFLITDLFLGFHSLQFFTWGSVLVIGYLSKYFTANFKTRISGVLIGSLLFFIISNFGVFALGSYGYTFQGLLTCYILAIPFFTNTVIYFIYFKRHCLTNLFYKGI